MLERVRIKHTAADGSETWAGISKKAFDPEVHELYDGPDETVVEEPEEEVTEPEEEGTDPTDIPDYSEMTKAELKAELKSRDVDFDKNDKVDDLRELLKLSDEEED